ncbi:MAG: aldo/keto reductase [SAR202 cluster bacterium]|jgi:aryl-alcohol dehydrogenase-like predicted oxidoreductase|nr:aldo/keto reductase [SAR202 cluster bacterium]MDP6302192.1 aldo/keto reductase [SAR202 cluster bacterium]MDP7103138.1 aldo/keto reductase [SAR202 cluster bacterium]MDP7224734.1 aldo/keto reductase [SAR202 cluster bacterium]MDP7412038.1 aldo/keto reductase [SAR202 cluster bacterium]|tara:strand:- start:1838 stop:2779 length:942 start_codon:yes stop_codon:yes gene_type:complete
MQYRQLGRSGLQVSAIGLGTNNFGGMFGSMKDPDICAEVVHRALDLGINMIDTSNSYTAGVSEEFIGRALRGRRNEAIIATKVSSRMAEGPNNMGNSRSHIMREIEASLRRLETDYIDLYQIHRPDPTTPIEETMRVLDDLVKSGKVRYIGSSNFAAWQACEAYWTAKSLGLTTFVSDQPRYSMMYRAPDRELVPFCDAYGVGILPFFPLESGFLTGKYRRGQPAPEGTRLAKRDGGRFTDANFDILEGLEAFAQEQGHTVLELAFAWLLAKPSVSSVIAGATSTSQIEANAAAAEWDLSDDDMAKLNDILTG